MSASSPAPLDLAGLAARLDVLETATAARACLTRYMRLCDVLDGSCDLDELGALFTRDAVWEGRGSRYATAFGRHEGRAAIAAFIGAYQSPTPHFRANAHFLTSETIEVEGADRAHGTWLMLQTPTFFDGSSFVMCADLAVDFAREDGRLRMSRFRTTNLWSRPVGDWNQPSSFPTPAPIASATATPTSRTDR